MLRKFTNFAKTLCSSHSLSNFNQLQLSMPYYAVAAGWEVGIFDTWSICEKKVKGFSKPKYKKFKTKEEAEEFLKSHGVSLTNSQSSDSDFNPRQDAVPLVRTPKKDMEEKLRKLVEQKFGKPKVASKRLYVLDSDDSEESLNDKKTKPQDISPPVEIKDSWPDDVEWEEDDEDILLTAAAEVEGISEVPAKRKAPNTTVTGAGNSNSFNKYHHQSKIWEPIGLKMIGKFEFSIDSEGFVIVYTDGSCINNGQSNSIAGFGVYFGEDHPLNAAKPVIGRVTNNAGEIQAAIHAIQIAKDLGITKLCLSTDSQFLINAATAWIAIWKQKVWKLRNGGEVKNKEDFQILDKLLDKSIEVKWNYVKGHKGIIGNERADRLARQGAALYRSSVKK